MKMFQQIPHEIVLQYLNNPYESLIIIDDEAKIVFISESVERFSSISAKDVENRKITEIFPDEGITHVLTTGRPEIGQAYLHNGNACISTRIPLKKNGKVLGAATKIIFWHTEKLNELYRTINGLKGKIKHYKKTLDAIYKSRYDFSNILGNSPLICKVKDAARMAAEVDSPVLLIGESGTGKELFAHAIHQHGKRRDNPFVRINCTSIPAELIEAELFGYEAGSFTGADRKGKIGKFEMADGGTIFLDEIGDMPLELQAKLLRVLEESEIQKIGGAPKRVNFRSIFATNVDIENLVTEKKFRLDLYYRMNVLKIVLPPLRHMRDDIPLHVENFMAKMVQEMPKRIDGIAESALLALCRYAWPGNIRELRNVVERALIVCKGRQIELHDLPENIVSNTSQPHAEQVTQSRLLKDRLAEKEREIIADTLSLSANNRTEAAKILGIHRTGLHKKMKKYKL
ncbi:sigma 54-interacting transcriptional regulator [Desulfosarcina sp. OttesenSCG-928-A07]|nr:sigma 54-interacting transcriptional regulator [Desulfosarcina sp. OttesenSCG-928-A07]